MWPLLNFLDVVGVCVVGHKAGYNRRTYLANSDARCSASISAARAERITTTGATPRSGSDMRMLRGCGGGMISEFYSPSGPYRSTMIRPMMPCSLALRLAPNQR